MACHLLTWLHLSIIIILIRMMIDGWGRVMLIEVHVGTPPTEQNGPWRSIFPERFAMPQQQYLHSLTQRRFISIS
jgi:hypothetical protein